MSEPDLSSDPLGPLAEEFLERLRRGERPSIREYEHHYPDLAGRIRVTFTALLQMEDLGPSDASEAVAGDLEAFARKPVPLPEDFEDYRIVREIGKGGMGVVYEAEQSSLDRRVALKVLSHALASEPSGLARFRREARLAAKLHHSNVVPVFDVGEAGESSFYTMQLIYGQNLHNVLSELRRLRAEGPRVAEEAAGPFPSTRAGEDASRAATIVARALLTDRFEAPRTIAPGVAPLRDDGALASDRRERPRPPSSEDDTGVSAALPGRRELSTAETNRQHYYACAARIGLQAAEGLAYIHSRGIIHRDIKPANLMLDAAGVAWIADLGLAQIHGESDESERDGHVPGTPRYMAPERYDGLCDARADIFALGLTIYELLTLRHAFEADDSRELIRQIREDHPLRPRSLDGRVPRNLEAIVLKAIAKDPDDRYPSAEAMAADLQRFLDCRPVAARPLGRVGVGCLWCRRNPGWATAVAATTLALAALGIGGYQAVKAAEARTRVSVAETTTSKARADMLAIKLGAEEKVANEAVREAKIRAAQGLLIKPHSAGWSEEVGSELSQAAAIGIDDSLHRTFASSLVGIDATEEREWTEFGASALAFDPSGRHLAIGDVSDLKLGSFVRPLAARLWDGDRSETVKSTVAARGPVAFRGDGTPVQLVVGAVGDPDRFTPTLWDLETGRELARFTIPVRYLNPRMPEHRILDLALADDASLAAVAIRWDDGRGVVFVWEAGSGRLLHRFQGVATAIAFAPDNSILVAGDGGGRITAWSLADGRELTSFPVGRIEVESLALHRERRLDDGERPTPLRGWQLAVGARGGLIRIWELESNHSSFACRGSNYDVFALRFTPDGTILASCGRYKVKLWDVATGNQLLDIPASNHILGLAFAPDGRRLAVGGTTTFGPDGHVWIWELRDGRGVRSLRGLSSPVERSTISPDGRFVAALTSDWEVGIWDRESGRLLWKAYVTPGFLADNAALAFDEQGARFAYSSGHEAACWSLSDGRRLGSWRLPGGLQDQLSFRGERLLLAREETADGVAPLGNADPRGHPRVVRVRDLLGADPTAPVITIRDYGIRIAFLAITSDSRRILLDGVVARNGELVREVNLYDVDTGGLIWSKPSGLDPSADPTPLLDPSGQLVQVSLAEGGPDPIWLSTEAGSRIPGPRTGAIRSIGLGGGRWIAETGVPEEMGIYKPDSAEPLLRLDVGQNPRAVGYEHFSPDGCYLIGGRADGIVTVCDLEEIRRQLDEVGLGR